MSYLYYIPIFNSSTGTETDFFAGYRACECLQGFYRLHMFEKCYKCGQGGLECKDDYATLKPGYWWEWRNETHKHRYRTFIKNMLASSPALDSFSVQFPYAMPTPYKCPAEDACKGGLDSPCKKGYEGPLCGVCSSGYYKQLQNCAQCPSKKWMVGQLSIVAVILLIILVLLVWMSRRKVKKAQGLNQIDLFLSKLKIVIGFYQVTNGLLETFSYIKWPDSLEAIAKYSGVLQLNVLQIAPFQCLYRGLQIDAFGSLFLLVSMNAGVIGFCGIVYQVRKVITLRSRSLDENEKSRRLSETKEVVYRNLFFFLYVTYLSTCFKTATVLPFACRKLCRDDNEEQCFKFLKADYSIQCQGSKYHQFLILAYISSAYIVVLLTASFIILWRNHKLRLVDSVTQRPQEQNRHVELITGLRFLFENYKHRSWYWELVEMSRKVILTSVLILVGQESRSYIGLTLVIAGMYGMLFSWIRPMQDPFENRMMFASLAVTLLNLAIGGVSRIPSENVPGSVYTYMEEVIFKMLVFGANTLVIGLLAGEKKILFKTKYFNFVAI